MNPDLTDEAREYEDAADRAFAATGGVDAARRAELDPATRAGGVAAALAAVGADEVDPRAGHDAALAAAVLCRAAGRVALPYPVPAVLLRGADDGVPFAVVPGTALRVDHADLFPRWRVARLDGAATVAEPAGTRLATRLGPFVGDLVAVGAAPDSPVDVAWHLALTSWQVLGVVERALQVTVEHVTTREQFGKPIAAFQAVQFQVADAAVAVAGLRELAQYTVWRLTRAEGDAMVDVLALRVHALDVARAVLRITQQLHGAAGVCDEYDVSVLACHAQPLLRLPFGAERAAEALADAVDRSGFAGLFPHGADAGVAVP